MKILIVSMASMVMVISGFSVLSEPSKDVLGKWRIDESYIPAATRNVISLTRKSNADLAQQMEDNLPAIEDMMRSMEYHFKDDHTYILQTPQGPQEGKWSFKDNNTSFVFTREGKPDRTDSVLEISPTRFKLINRERKDTLLFVHP